MTLSVLIALILSQNLMPSETLAILSVKLLKATTAGTIPVQVTLKNRSKHSVTIWDPGNYEGQAALHFIVQNGHGQEFDFTPPVPPRAAGVPTAKSIASGATISLAPVDLQGLRARKKLPAGEYHLIAVYENKLPSRGPVSNVWTGRIKSRAIALRLN